MRVSFRLATLTDTDLVLTLVAEYYAYDGHVFDVRRLRNPLETLLTHPQYGRVWLVFVEDKLAGYMVATYGFALESGGRDLLVDELYLRDAFRGLGIGRVMIEYLQDFCRQEQITLMYLEVESHNTNAAAFYTHLGFQADDSTYYMLTVSDDVSIG